MYGFREKSPYLASRVPTLLAFCGPRLSKSWISPITGYSSYLSTAPSPLFPTATTSPAGAITTRRAKNWCATPEKTPRLTTSLAR